VEAAVTGIRERIDHLLDRRRESRSTAELEAEVDKLRTQNERLRAAMRRCVTCDYRLAVTGDRADAPADPAADHLSTDRPTRSTDDPTGDANGSPTAVPQGAEP
jgi:hypothetical protein